MVEVLKGPQGILFGKNTIGGAINITTNKPTFENEAIVDALYSEDQNEQIYTAVVNGELTDRVAGRLAVRYDSMDGWWDNRLLERQGPNTDNWYTRGSLLFDASARVEVLAKYEYGDFKTDDKALVVYQSDQPENIFGDDVFPIVDDRDEAAFDLGDNNEVRTDVAAITVNWGIDFAVTAGLHRTLDERYKQYSQELRLISPGGETLDWIAGAYYEYAELAISRTNTALDFALSGPLSVPALVYLPGSVPEPSKFDLDTDSLGVFGQATYSVTDTERVTGGLRYNYEKKTLDKRAVGELGVRFGVPQRPRSVALQGR